MGREGRGRIRAATLGWGSPASVDKYLPVCCLRNTHRLTPREPLPLSDSRDGNQMKEGRRKTLCRFLLPYYVPYIPPHPPALLCLALCILTSNITAASVGAGSVTSHAVACLAPPTRHEAALLLLVLVDAFCPRSMQHRWGFRGSRGVGRHVTRA